MKYTPKIVRITTVPMSLKHLLTDQMNFMKKNGFEVIMASADGDEVEYVKKNEGCDHFVLPLTRKITPIKDAYCIFLLYKKLKKIQPNIIHSHTPKAGLIAMIAGWLARVPIRIHTVAGLPLQTAHGIKKTILTQTEVITYQFATHVLPNSNSIKNFIIKNKITHEGKLSVIGAGSSNGIDVENFSRDSLDLKKLDTLKKSINYNEKDFYILFVGRLVKDKGIVELVNAFVKLKSDFPYVKLLLVGPLEQELDPLDEITLNEIRTNESIVSIGYSNDVKYYMAMSHLFAFPSHREGFPNSPMQASLMGLPIVASRIDGNIDIVHDKIDGFLHEPNSEMDLFKKLSYAIENYKDMLKMNALLQNKIRQRFDRAYVHKSILDFYNKFSIN